MNEIVSSVALGSAILVAFMISNDAVNNKVLLVPDSLAPWVETITPRAGA